MKKKSAPLLVALGVLGAVALVAALLTQPRWDELGSEVTSDARGRFELVLRGRLLNNIDETYPIGVQAHVPAEGAVHVAAYAGEDVLDHESRFEFPVRCERIPDRFQLAFGSVQEFERLLTTEVSTEELISEEGATLEWYASELAVSVVGEGGESLERAGVDIESDGWGGYRGSSSPTSFLLPPGRFGILATSDGYAFGRDEVELGSGLRTVRRTLTLRRLTDADRITGRVLDSRGQPVEEAAVSARPETKWQELDPLTTAYDRSAADGSFSLVMPTDGPIRVDASHETHGFAPDVLLEAGAKEVTLQFEPKGGVRIDLTDLPSDRGARVAMVQWTLVRKSTNQRVSNRSRGEHFLVGDLLEGEYELCVCLLEDGLYAQQTIAVRGEQTTEVEVPMRRGRFVNGTLTRADGSIASGLNVVVLETDLPAGVRENWSRSTTGIDGGFRLLVGTSGRGKAAVFDMQKNELGHIDVKVGEDTYVLR